jgi:hypothetical protein
MAPSQRTARLVAAAALPAMGAAYDPALLSQCATCNSTTQPSCMQLLEVVRPDSSTYDPLFASQVRHVLNRERRVA